MYRSVFRRALFFYGYPMTGKTGTTLFLREDAVPAVFYSE